MKNKLQTILVTGANGQLGSGLKMIASRFPGYQFLFTTREELSIADPAALTAYFAGHEIHYCINCAAYTAVDKAESEKEKALRVNAEAAGHLAKVCRQHNTRLIHVSTDYVFNGSNTRPYKETDSTDPLGVYGASKLKGEELVLKNDPSAIIIRTSWLYSSFGNNFVKTMLRLMREKESINVVNDQSGCPTYAVDLAEAIMKIIASGKAAEHPGIYHFAGSGVTTWFGFASAIKVLTKSSCTVNPIPTSQYPTPAKRPPYSVLDTKKIRDTFGISIPEWKKSLEKCLAFVKN